MIGYDEDGNWIIKNSWGTSWGDGGFGIVSKDYNCGINVYADYLVFTDGNVYWSLQLFDSGNDGYEGWVFGFRDQVTGEVVF